MATIGVIYKKEDELIAGTARQVIKELKKAGHKVDIKRPKFVITLGGDGTILRAEERSDDIFASIDAVLDKIHRQIARYKGKRRARGRRARGEPIPIEELEEEAHSIVRVKQFSMIPMTQHEAIEQMELLGHDFFVFFNSEVEGINVLYRRKDGDYGLLQPELK